MNTLPVPFIVGVGRSGTTLLRLMLDAHSTLAIPPETHFLPALLAAMPGDAASFMGILKASHTWPDFHLDEAGLQERLQTLQPFTLAAAVACFYTCYAERVDKPRWGDKSPTYVEYLQAIHQLLPQVGFIHIIRDGRDVALSYRDKWFGPGADIEAAAHFWRSRIEAARAQAARLPASCYLEVRYEDLLEQPREQLERICSYLELTFQPSMLDYHLTAGQRLGEMGDRRDAQGEIVVSRQQRLSIHQHTARPPDARQAGKWQQAYTAEEVARFHAVAGDLLTQLGYAT